jgi:RHS repeat-associated protein
LTGDGTLTYTWDAHNRLQSAAGVTYTYDGDGQRVAKSNGTLYWYGPDGSPLAEIDPTGNTISEYIFLAGRRIARRDAGSALGVVYYYFGDHLGTARAVTTATGTVCYDADFYPFGAEMPVTNNCPHHYKFTGHERDTETGLDHTQHRKYASNLGRWLSPDPMAGGVGSLQSWNRYAYALNNPTTLTDPMGLGSPPPGAQQYYTNLANYQRMCNQNPLACNYMNYPSMVIILDYSEMEGSYEYFTTVVGPQGKGPGPPGGGSGGPSVHVTNLHKSGNDINTITSRLNQIAQCLDPKCRAFLQSGGGNVNNFISGLLGNNLLAAGNVSPNSIAAFTGTAGTNVPPGYAAMVVNNTGAFFSSSYTVDNGSLTGGRPRAQAFILLHELGHALGAKGFQADLGNNSAGKANDKLIQDNCGATLSQFAN